MARIVIAGCGDVGTALGVRLAAAGHDVWGLKRNPSTLPETIRPLAADLSRPESLTALPSGIDQVVYAVAAGGYTPENYQMAYVDGVRHLLALLAQRAEPVQRLIFVSSSSVYGQTAAEWVDEGSPAAAQGFAPESLRTGEQCILQSGYSASVVRFAGIYGPGRTYLIRQVQSGQARCQPGLYTNRIHRDDCASVLQHILSLAEPAPVYLGVDNHPAPQCEVLTWLADTLGCPPPVSVAGSDRDRNRARSNKRCRNQRLLDSGWTPSYPDYRAGYQSLLDSL